MKKKVLISALSLAAFASVCAGVAGCGTSQSNTNETSANTTQTVTTTAAATVTTATDSWAACILIRQLWEAKIQCRFCMLSI